MNQAGDIILTRNTEEVGNNTPGYWNHAAISAGNYILEAQAEPVNSVIAVQINVFRLRYPEYIVLRYPDATAAYQAANTVYQLLGTPYRKVASIFHRLRPAWVGENCTSLVRRGWIQPLGHDPKWKLPDHIYNYTTQGNCGYIRDGILDVIVPPEMWVYNVHLNISPRRYTIWKVAEYHKDYDNWKPINTLGLL